MKARKSFEREREIVPCCLFPHSRCQWYLKFAIAVENSLLRCKIFENAASYYLLTYLVQPPSKWVMTSMHKSSRIMQVWLRQLLCTRSDWGNCYAHFKPRFSIDRSIFFNGTLKKCDREKCLVEEVVSLKAMFIRPDVDSLNPFQKSDCPFISL